MLIEHMGQQMLGRPLEQTLDVFNASRRQVFERPKGNHDAVTDLPRQVANQKRFGLVIRQQGQLK